MGCAVLRGFLAEGVLPCAKHFPGHGDAAVDPHLDLPRFDGTRERLLARELVPFAAAIDAGVPLIMTAHILLPQIDSVSPASLSSELLETILRTQLAFEGVVLADDLGMGAIARHYGNSESVVKTLQAGTDIAMLCHDWTLVAPALEAVAQATSSGHIDPRGAFKAHARIERLRERLREIDAKALPPPGVIGCPEHRALAAEVRARIGEAMN